LEVRASGVQGSADLAPSSTPAEVVLVRFEVAPAASVGAGDGGDDVLDSLLAILASRSSVALASAVRSELEAAFGVQLVGLGAEKSLVVRRPEPETAAPSWPDMAAQVGGAASAGFCLGACCIGVACLALAYSRRSRQGSASAAAEDKMVKAAGVLQVVV
jgi:hypothetical protein